MSQITPLRLPSDPTKLSVDINQPTRRRAPRRSYGFTVCWRTSCWQRSFHLFDVFDLAGSDAIDLTRS